MLKGYVCNIPVKLRTADGGLAAAPAGIPIKLSDTSPTGFRSTVVTDGNGIAAFDEIPAKHLYAYFDEELCKKAADNGKALYSVNKQVFSVLFSSKDGFTPSEEDGFIIETTLVEGFIKQ